MGEGSLFLASELGLVVLLPEAAEDGLDGRPSVVAIAGAMGVHSANNVPRLPIKSRVVNP